MKRNYFILLTPFIFFGGCVTTRKLTKKHESLIGKYTFDNGSIKDLSSQGIDASLTNVEFVEDRFGNRNSAVQFNGTSSRIECSNNDRNITNSITVMAWIKMETGDLPAVVTKYDWHEDKGFSLRLREKGEAAIEGRDGNNKYRQSGHEGSLYDNSWHHIIGVISNNEWIVYVDGKMTSSSINENTSVDLTNTSTLTIGALPVPNGKGNFRYFKGIIDNVLIYNTALDEQQIKKIFKKSKKKSL